MHNLDTDHLFKKIEALYQIRQSAIDLEQCLKSDDPEELEAARHAHKDLLDQFYSETSEYVPISQYKAAEKNFEYFRRLIYLALVYFIDEMKGTGKVQ
jgi:hypothetical protein